MWDDSIASQDIDPWLSVDFRAFDVAGSSADSPPSAYPPSGSLSSPDDLSTMGRLLEDQQQSSRSPSNFAAIMGMLRSQQQQPNLPPPQTTDYNLSRQPSQNQHPQLYSRDMAPQSSDLNMLTAQILLRAQQQHKEALRVPPQLPNAASDPASLSMLLNLMQPPVVPQPAPVSDLAYAALQLVAAAGNSNAFSLLSSHLLAATNSVPEQQPNAAPPKKQTASKAKSSPPSRAAAPAATPAPEDDEDDGTQEVYYNKDGKEMTAEEADKRKRNTAASARFRAKKKMREQEVARTAKDMTTRVESLEKRLVEYEMEIRWLRQLVTERNNGKRLRDIYEENGLVLRDGTEAAGSNPSDVPVTPGTRNSPLFKSVTPGANSIATASASKFLQTLNLDPEVAKQVLMSAAAQAANVQRSPMSVLDLGEDGPNKRARSA
ncbi:hypothetical protein BJ742DRAFT_769300 [Cladochytrium replicatum]|nr:hypothetical protein BJ742DRAFT_769300 [Cladochytrium replicatum]